MSIMLTSLLWSVNAVQGDEVMLTAVCYAWALSAPQTLVVDDVNDKEWAAKDVEMPSTML